MMSNIEYCEAELLAGADLIPGHMLDGVRRYVINGIPMGSFGTAIFSNDFMGAAGRADQDNLYMLEGWARFLYNHVPSGCKGSAERVSDWIAKGGAAGNVSELAA